MAKKFFFAPSSFYLNSTSIEQPNDLPDLLGQVVQCPSKKNDYCYEVKWLRGRSGENCPEAVANHLRTQFPKEDVHSELLFMVSTCPMNHTWRPIEVDEMYRFLGILLRISVQPMDAGGYVAYFRDTNISIPLSNDSNRVFELPETRGFVSMIAPEYRMSLNRFKQIRGCFHPEDKALANGSEDKCYMLRKAINSLNAASLSNFVPEPNLSFDEGGIACRSRYCPVRQYNKDKPAKFRVDFFILAGAKTYIIYHIDVYQGKNASNVYIEPCCMNLPTTMKAVANAVHHSEVHKGSNMVNGFRTISLDNRYQCPQLALLMREK